jgi:FkbM family methyltransferase
MAVKDSPVAYNGLRVNAIWSISATLLCIMTRELLSKAWRPIYARRLSAQARRMRRKRLQFYSSFIGSGDLVFDIGANIGERSDRFLALGAVVVAVEPQVECTELMRCQWKDEPRFTLFEDACAETAGERELFVSDASTLSSMSPEWIDAVRRNGVFSDYQWDETRVVATITLDMLVAEQGTPDFLKIDVEGFEYGVLSGLTQPVGCASIEWHGVSLSASERCIDRLSSIGMDEFNVSLGESMSWELPRWVPAVEVIAFLNGVTDKLAWGDCYARRSGHRSPE